MIELYKKIVAFLSQPYPFYYKGKSLKVVSFLIFIVTFLFLYFYEPFVTTYDPVYKMDYFWIVIIRSFIPVIIISLLSFLKFAFPSENRWNIKKEIILIAIFLLLVGITQFLIRDIIYDLSDNWSLYFFITDIEHTFLIGSLLIIIVISFNYNRLNSKNIGTAHELSYSLNSNKNTQTQTVLVSPKVKSEEFVLNVNDFLYAKAVGNYVELHLKGEEKNYILKRMTLKELINALKQYPNIFKTHRSYIVNLNFIEKVSGNAQGYKLQLSSCEEEVPVARNIIPSFDNKVKEV
ncbi:LytR/AlgR family response regulator transcription factor [Tenacibaculum amylolyticum]|uniref:LytR/AlgR family response regulator transcription factor n=1 Tax=Tenacibaculum amylolyticum TaxID=104269 RepID=UPI003892F84E